MVLLLRDFSKETSEILSAMEASTSNFRQELRWGFSELESKLVAYINAKSSPLPQPTTPPYQPPSPPTETSSFPPLSSTTAAAAPSLLKNPDSPSFPPQPTFDHLLSKLEMEIPQAVVSPPHVELAMAEPLPPSELPGLYHQMPPLKPTSTLGMKSYPQNDVADATASAGPEFLNMCLSPRCSLLSTPPPLGNIPTTTAHSPVLAPTKCLRIVCPEPILRDIHGRAILTWIEEPPGFFSIDHTISRQITPAFRDKSIERWNTLGEYKYTIPDQAVHSDLILCDRFVLNTMQPPCVSVSWDKTVKIGNLTNCKLRSTLAGHSRHVKTEVVFLVGYKCFCLAESLVKYPSSVPYFCIGFGFFSVKKFEMGDVLIDRRENGYCSSRYHGTSLLAGPTTVVAMINRAIRFAGVVRQECKTAFGQYGQVIKDLSMAETQPKEICPQVGVCTFDGTQVGSMFCEFIKPLKSPLANRTTSVISSTHKNRLFNLESFEKQRSYGSDGSVLPNLLVHTILARLLGFGMLDVAFADGIEADVKSPALPRSAKGPNLPESAKSPDLENAEISSLIANLVSHLRVRTEDNGVGSDMILRAWDNGVTWKLVLTHPKPSKGACEDQGDAKDKNSDNEELCILMFRPRISYYKAEIEFMKQGNFIFEELDALVSALKLAGQQKKIGLVPRGDTAQVPTPEKTISNLEAMGVKVYELKTPNQEDLNAAISWDTVAGISWAEGLSVVFFGSSSLAILHYILEKDPPRKEQISTMVEAFNMSMFWISTVVGELSNCLATLGLLLRLPSALLGLTVLAWGNAVGELVVALVFLLRSLMGPLLVVTWNRFRVPRFWKFMHYWALHYFHDLVLSFRSTTPAIYLYFLFRFVDEGTRGCFIIGLPNYMVKDGTQMFGHLSNFSVQHSVLEYAPLQITHPLQELQGDHHLEDKVVFKTWGVDTTQGSNTTMDTLQQPNKNDSVQKMPAHHQTTVVPSTTEKPCKDEGQRGGMKAGAPAFLFAYPRPAAISVFVV